MLADDLFRLRVSSGKSFSPLPSWAVSKRDWPLVTARIHSDSREVSIKTKLGQCTLQLNSCRWELADARGKSLLTATACGFSEAQARVTLSLRDCEAVHGLGEMTGPLDKRGLVREFWNADVLGQASCMHAGLRNLYVSIPFGISLRSGRAAGIFWDNPARQVWDLGQSAPDEWRLEAATGEIDLYLFTGPRVTGVVERYTELTGRMPLPPRWALGYHQSRYSYASRAELERVGREFRRRKIPCDALYLDIHHMDGHRVFTFGKTFPRPRQMLAKLARRGFKVIAIVDPGVKDDAKFGVLKRGRALNAFVKARGGKKDFIGKAWPGRCRFPDFLNVRARRWWVSEQVRFMRLGLAGVWCDMNEPALFDIAGKTLPGDCVHRDNRSRILQVARRGAAQAEASDYVNLPHSSQHNLYGLLMARAARAAALWVSLRSRDERPFVLTRAGYAGVQRYATVWTGDNSSSWEHLAESVPMLLNLSLSGVAFCGADAGGFLDNCTGELLARWTQLAACTPFFRNHSNCDSRPQEPWAFGPEVERVCKKFIELRYRLLPYLGKLFTEAHERGTPIMRPLFWHYPDDKIAARIGDQFLLGADLLVAPVLQPGCVARCVYLPRGEWVNFWNRRERVRGGRHIVASATLDTLPLFVRAGAKLALGPLRQFMSLPS